jgi:hypothetical protein
LIGGGTGVVGGPRSPADNARTAHSTRDQEVQGARRRDALRPLRRDHRSVHVVANQRERQAGLRSVRRSWDRSHVFASAGGRVMAGDWFDGAGNGNAIDAAAIVNGVPMQGVLEMVDAGALVSLGKTSDGGALGVTVTVDGRWRREYFRSSDELGLWIAEALPAIHEARGTVRPSAAPRQRQRRSRAT